MTSPLARSTQNTKQQRSHLPVAVGKAKIKQAAQTQKLLTANSTITTIKSIISITTLVNTADSPSTDNAEIPHISLSREQLTLERPQINNIIAHSRPSSSIRAGSPRSPRTVLTSAGWKQRVCSAGTKTRIPTPRTRQRATTLRVLGEIVSPATGPQLPALEPSIPLLIPTRRKLTNQTGHNIIQTSPITNVTSSTQPGVTIRTRSARSPSSLSSNSSKMHQSPSPLLQTPHLSSALPLERPPSLHPTSLHTYSQARPTRAQLIGDLRRQQTNSLKKIVSPQANRQQDYFGAPLLLSRVEEKRN